MRAAFGLSGQKCSANSRVYVERPVYDEFLRRLAEKTQAITVGDPLDSAELDGPGHQPEGRRSIRERRRDARQDGRIVIGGERLTGGAYDAGFFVAPTVAAGPAHGPPAVPGRAVPALHRGRPGRLARRSAHPVQRQRPGPDRRASTPTMPASSSGSSMASRRASSTSTAGPARRPVPGRASSRSVAGRAPPRPASPAAASTTSSSSCGSSPRRSSAEVDDRVHGGMPMSALIAALLALLMSLGGRPRHAPHRVDRSRRGVRDADRRRASVRGSVRQRAADGRRRHDARARHRGPDPRPRAQVPHSGRSRPSSTEPTCSSATWSASSRRVARSSRSCIRSGRDRSPSRRSRRGFDLVGLANNHALDFGRTALRDTIRNVRAAGIRPMGAGADAAASRAPVIVERNGLRIAFLDRADAHLDSNEWPRPRLGGD